MELSSALRGLSRDPAGQLGGDLQHSVLSPVLVLQRYREEEEAEEAEEGAEGAELLWPARMDPARLCGVTRRVRRHRGGTRCEQRPPEV